MRKSSVKRTASKTVEASKNQERKVRRRAWLSFIQKIRLRALAEWLFFIPWKRLFRAVARLLRRRVLTTVCFFAAFGIALGIFALSVSAAVCAKTADRTYTLDTLSQLEGEFDCVLVLGCRVYADGTMSHMLEDRVTTAVTVFQSGIGAELLMSGDSSSSVGYDEVGAMRRAAIEQGVDPAVIDTDPYGLSTYESIVRFAEKNRGRRVVIVTQSFHLPRALYIADKLGLEAYGVSADLRPYQTQMKSDVREIFARCKDVYGTLKRSTQTEMPAA